jgi:adenine-specific DNA-methyltransferase
MSAIKERKNGRNHGEIFTAQGVVCYQLDQLGYCADRNLSAIRILEPASGSGAFALEIVKRLYQSAQLFEFNFTRSLVSNVRFVESDGIVYQSLIRNIDELVSDLGEHVTNLSSFCKHADFLKANFSTGFDCIVGNPPYIRHERLSDEQKAQYRKQFSTFTHRADLYVAFFEKSLDLLRSGGMLCFICSNRWLTNQYGAKLRLEIASKFRLLKLLNMEQASPFDEEVIAYPCINPDQQRITFRANLNLRYPCQANRF